MTRLIKYGLYHKKRETLLRTDTPLTFESDIDETLRYALSSDETTGFIWLVDTKLLAEQVKNSPDVKDNTFGSPYHYFKPEELEVVEVKLTLKLLY